MPAGFHRAGCCCVEFCLGCEFAEPDAVVTIVGAGEGDCAEWCDVYEGTFEYQGRSHDTSGQERYCTWGMQHETIDSAHLTILYCHASETWYARLTQIGTLYGGTVDNPCAGITTDDWKEVAITCEEGVLVGNFELDGLGDCAGCTASVTLE